MGKVFMVLLAALVIIGVLALGLAATWLQAKEAQEDA